MGDKAEADAQSGGSYGFGKSVYSGSSDIRTVVAYSVFSDENSPEGENARLMACSYFQGHSYDDLHYTGRAWYGKDDPQSGMVLPATDEEAHEIAASLGIPVRGQHDTGTSVLVLGCSAPVDKLRDGVEKYWWPRLHDGELEVSFFEEGDKASPPRPKLRKEIRGFMDAYDVLCNRADPDPSTQEKHEFNRYKDNKLGVYTFSVIQDWEPTDSELDSDYVNSVALIRGPRMVVEYWKIGYSGREPCCGVFVSHPEIERILKLSEPSSHDEWDPSSSRLEPDESDVVERLRKRIRDYFRQFQRNVTPEPAHEQGMIPELQRLLGRFFRRSDRVPPPPPKFDDPVAIQIESMARSHDGGKTAISGRVRVGLRPDSQFEHERVRVQVNLSTLVDDTRRVEEKHPMEIEVNPAATHAIEGDGASAILSLEQGQTVSFNVKAESIDPFASYQVGVEVSQAAPSQKTGGSDNVA